MAGNAFTAGVKPGGLTTSTEIRILLCYLIQHAGTPLSQGELETALLGEELVNYFELASNLSDLLEQGFVREENGRYTILPAGADIAEALADDVPRSVRDAAVGAPLAGRPRKPRARTRPPVFAAEQKHVLCRPYIPKPPAAFPPVPPSPIDKTVPAC